MRGAVARLRQAIGFGWLLSVLAGCSDVGGVCAQAELDAGMLVLVRDAMGPMKHPRVGGYTFTVTTEFGVMTWGCEVGADDGMALACGTDQQLSGKDSTALLMSALAGEDGFRLVMTRLESNVWTGPRQVRVEIKRDGEVVAEERYAPKYAYSRLSGGRGCPQYWVLEGDPPTIEL